MLCARSRTGFAQTFPPKFKMRLLGFFASCCFAFQISIKQTHTGVEKRSKTIQLPGAFADLTIRKGDKVTYSAETTEDFTQLIIAFKGKHGESHSFYLDKPLTIVQIAYQDPTIKPGMYACTIYAVKGSESKAFKIGNLQISGEVAVTDVKPELFHTFNPPQKQGSMVLAVIFTALVLSPVFVLGSLVRID